MSEFSPTDPIELEVIIKNLDNNKASNINQLSTKLFKECALSTLPQLNYLINLILLTSQIPIFWKTATVIPIFKSGDKNLISNYRPISLLPVIAKVIEKVIFRRIYRHVNDNHLLSENQGGFLPNLGTNDTVKKFLGDIYLSINKGEPTLSIFYDLKKAFDTIDHRILLKKLEFMGFHNSALSLLTNYLSDRFQSTYVNNSLSSKLPITCGVPQGSTLGPLLFILYINDMPLFVQGASVRLYADDTVFYTGAHDILTANQQMNSAASEFSKWCCYNKLTINTKKSKCLLFSNKSLKNHNTLKSSVKINIEGDTLELVSDYKYLGIHLDENLNFRKHVNYLYGIVTARLYTLSKARSYMSTTIALLLFKTMILNYFDIGDLFYNSCNQRDLRRMHTLQNRALRIIYYDHLQSTLDELHKRANLLWLQDRRNLNLIISAHQRREGFYKLKVPQQNSHTLRPAASTNLHMPYMNNKKFENSFIIKSIRLWNQISNDLKETLPSKYHLVKTRVRKEMILNKLNFPE